MTKKLLFALPLIVLPSLAMAQSASVGPGGGTDLYRVLRDVDAMQRDGRWAQLLAEIEANRQAARQVVEPSSGRSVVFTAQAPTRARRPR